MFIKRSFALAALSLIAVSATPAAQCSGPDGLNGPCCSFVPANLPSLGQWSLPGASICFNACIPTQETNRINFGTPTSVLCGQYTAPMSITDMGGALILGGTLIMDYTRTWEEFVPGAPPQQYQVYRFAVKIDMIPAGAPGNACNTPSCLPGSGTAFYYGYLDYAFDCGTGVQSNALVLYHNCDFFIHKPGLSSIPGVFHPATSYALVWPSTTVNPFVAATFPAPGGPLAGEATRLMPPLGVAACITEDPISSGSITPVGSGCACPLSASPIQTTGRRMMGKGSCPNAAGLTGSFLSLNFTPSFPWFEVMSNSIGFWTTGAGYPGNEQVWVEEGVFLVKDVCSSTLTGQFKFGEVYYGASTHQGYTVVPSPVNPTITHDMIDLASNASRPLPGPITFPLVGSVVPTRNVIYMNF